ncbi:hypothetical protein ACIRP0_23920 [Streptomyces sp. NPDC101733]|uniref:hypothetical protein n=1 Tax=unclassified Streptomyces TaxID=2593676 RepID=UPI0037F6EF97
MLSASRYERGRAHAGQEGLRACGWATKVAGPAPLVQALLDDMEVEAVRLPWAS